MRLRWGHFCKAAKVFNGEWVVVAVAQTIPLRPELRGVFPEVKLIAMLEADPSEAEDGQGATVQLIHESGDQIQESAPLPVQWSPIAPGFPLLADVDLPLTGWPLTRMGRYDFQVRVNSKPVGKPVELYALPANGKLTPPREGQLTHGLVLEWAHFAKAVHFDRTSLSFELIHEGRIAPAAGRHYLRGQLGGAIIGGTKDADNIRTRVELRRANGTPIYVSPINDQHLWTPAPGHLKGGFFMMDLPMVEVEAPGDYAFAVIAEGKADIGSIEFPVIVLA